MDNHKISITQNTSLLLDVIRSISAQLVLIGHLFAFYLGKPSKEIFYVQNFGVLVFFILSGFLITFSLFNKKTSYTYKEYIIDRFARIFVSFLPALIFIYIFDKLGMYLFHKNDFETALDLKHLIGNLFMLQDFPLWRIFDFRITSFGSGRPLWTVAIEWWLYLFFGFLWFKRYFFKRSILIFVVFLILLIIPLTNILGRGNGLTLTWFLGSLVCFLFLKTPLITEKIANIKFILIVVLFAGCRVYFIDSFYDPCFAILLSAIFFSAIGLSSKKHLNIPKLINKAIKDSAAFSYSLYLIHYTIIVFVLNAHLSISVWLQIPLCFIICNIIAYLFAYFTEFKVDKLRKFLKNKFL